MADSKSKKETKNVNVNIVQLNPIGDGNKNIKNSSAPTGQETAVEKKQPIQAKEKDSEYIIELQIQKLDKNESKQLVKVIAPDKDKAIKAALKEYKAKMPKNCSCIPTGRYSRRDI